jgi:hypothetical protein
VAYFTLSGSSAASGIQKEADRPSEYGCCPLVQDVEAGGNVPVGLSSLRCLALWSLSQAWHLGGRHRASPVPFRDSSFTSGLPPPDATPQRLSACLIQALGFSIHSIDALRGALGFIPHQRKGSSDELWGRDTRPAMYRGRGASGVPRVRSHSFRRREIPIWRIETTLETGRFISLSLDDPFTHRHLTRWFTVLPIVLTSRCSFKMAFITSASCTSTCLPQGGPATAMELTPPPPPPPPSGSSSTWP